MDLSSLTTSDLRRASELLTRKGALLGQIKQIDAELANFGRATRAAPAAGRRVAAAATGRQGRRGQLKEAIIGLLKSAGKSGITVKEIAQRTGRKPGNIYTWFFTTGKTVREVKKVGGGRYAWAG